MIALQSLEAEHGVLGAMLVQPHLIDVLTEQLSPDAFAYPENADLYRLIMAMHDEGTPIDVVMLAERKPMLANEVPTIGYLLEIRQNTASVANAKHYAGIVRDRAIARQIASVGAMIAELAADEAPIEDKVSQAQALALGLDLSGSDAECHMAADLMRAHIEILQERHDRTSSGVSFEGLSSGIPDVDRYTQGMKPGQMIVVAGRPSMGKTTFAMNMASHVAIELKKPVLVVSLEMSKEQLMDRLLSAVGGIPLPTVKDGSCSYKHDKELAAASYKLSHSPICISDVPVMTMPRIRSIARRQKHRMGGMSLIVLDYLGLVEGDGNGRVEDVTAMSRQVKLLAREMGCPVVVLCQLNRGCESRPDKRPVLSDLRESGAIEQDADIVMFVYRDEVYFPNTASKGIGEILVRKNRDGELGTVLTSFQGSKSRFVPLAASDRIAASQSGEDW